MGSIPDVHYIRVILPELYKHLVPQKTTLLKRAKKFVQCTTNYTFPSKIVNTSDRFVDYSIGCTDTNYMLTIYDACTYALTILAAVVY